MVVEHVVGTIVLDVVVKRGVSNRHRNEVVAILMVVVVMVMVVVVGERRP